MRNEIISNLNDPGQLEKLYRADQSHFKEEFSSIYPRISGNPLADFWYERLNYESDSISWGSRNDFVFIVIASIFAGLLAKLPAFLSLNEEFFYPRNISFIVLPFLTAYFAWKNELGVKRTAFIGATIAICAIYMNSLPNNIDTSDTFLLACVHMPLFLWVIFGISFAGNDQGNSRKRLDFLRFNGDLLVMSAMLVLAAVLMTGITIGLFHLIGLDIEKFYFENVVVFALPSIPIIATYLTHTNPQLVNKVSPVIAKIFSPLVLVMLIIYLCAILFSGKDPYNDREFLLLFNILLIGVMALVFFSVAENSSREKSASGNWVILLLSVVTIIVNGIALSAVLFRISEWGITPNRLAVLGGNVLILVNLLLVTYKQFEAVKDEESVVKVENSIASFLPLYFGWVAIVVFLFPILFDFQ